MIQNRIFGLDAVRAFAILLVMISHSRFFNHHFIDLYKLGNLGYLGVELFFVLSGFLIGQILIGSFEKDSSLANLFDFWLKRWIRTLPNYYLFLLIVTFIALLIIEKPTPKHPLFYLFFFQNFAWERPLFFRESWSLCVEEWFYLIFPITLFFINKITRNINKSIIIAALVIMLISLITRLWLRWQDFTTIRMIVLCRLDGMMFGILVAYIKFYHKEIYYKYRQSYLYVGLFLFLITTIYTIFYIKNNFFDKMFLFYIVSFSFALILPFADSWKAIKVSFFSRAVEKISLWSYSLYLCNISIEEILVKIRNNYGLMGLKSSFVLLIVFWIISIAFAAFIYTFFEKPVLSKRDSLIRMIHKKN
jgi:peptidoglycan/LPS O-acetylase OafA/YrhL